MRLHSTTIVLVAASLTACASAPPQTPTPTPGPSAAPPAAPAPAATKDGATRPAYPPTPKRPVTDDYGVARVTDDYEWLENDRDPEVKRWAAAENALARSILDAAPARAEIRARVATLVGSRSPRYSALVPRGRALFAVKRQPPKPQPFVVKLTSLDDPASEKVIVDPGAIDPSGKTAMDFVVPSTDGKLVAVSLSVGGSEDGTVHVFDAETGKERGDVVPRANKGTGGGALAWAKDGRGFWYTRYPAKGERPDGDLDFYQQIWFHALGTSADKDTYAFGKDAPRIAEFELSTSDDGAWLIVKMKYGDGGEQAFWLHDARDPKGAWTPLAAKEAKVEQVAFGRDGFAYVLSRDHAPRGKVLRTPLARPSLASAQEIVPESDAVIESIAPTKEHLYVADLIGGPSQLRAFPLPKAAGAQVIALPPISSAEDLVALPGDEVAFAGESYVSPAAWYRVRAAGAPAKTALAQTSDVDFGDVEVVREVCTSKDGTKVPLNVMRPKGIALDGSHPTLLTGYGGYGLSRKPTFRPIRRLWLDQGGVWAEANLRGGGELGEEWHHQGYLTHKQNVFDDFAACMRAVVDRGYTKPEKLAIVGGSNGGLLMGAALTQHPTAMKAVVSYFGIYDSVRTEREPNGEYNVTEYGTMKNPDEARAILAYSPYHHVEDGQAYPAVLFLHGDNDPRVAPWQSRKMTARLQAATSSSAPILLRTSGDQGHLHTSLSGEIEEQTDAHVFLFQALGIPFRAK